jgi:hypothetical protein
MANEEHLRILKQGVEVWNRWREENPGMRPDLSEADLSGFDLDKINFNNANLAKIILKLARLFAADLGRADLNHANLIETKLVDTNLNEADLHRSELRGAYLVRANLIAANLTGADLSTIDRSIRVHDKLLLVLSEHSMASQWVEQEVETALARERKQGETVLFPVRLDDAVMEIESGWPALITNTRHIGDFSQWKDHDAYQEAFERLLRDLKAKE